MPLLFVCPRCKSPEVQGTAWVNVNTNEVVDVDSPSDEYWCPHCEEHFNSLEEIYVENETK